MVIDRTDMIDGLTRQNSLSENILLLSKGIIKMAIYSHSLVL